MDKVNKIYILVYKKAIVNVERHGRWYDDDDVYLETSSHTLYSSAEDIELDGFLGTMQALEISNLMENHENESCVLEDEHELRTSDYRVYYTLESICPEISQKICDILNLGLEQPLYFFKKIEPTQIRKGPCRNYYSYEPAKSDVCHVINVSGKIDMTFVNKYFLRPFSVDEENKINKEVELRNERENYRCKYIRIREEFETKKYELEQAEKKLKEFDQRHTLLDVDTKLVYLRRVADFYFSLIRSKFQGIDDKLILPTKLGIQIIDKLPNFVELNNKYSWPINYLYPLDIALLSMNSDMVSYLLDLGATKMAGAYLEVEYYRYENDLTNYLNGEQEIWIEPYSGNIKLLFFILKYLCKDDLALYFKYIKKLNITNEQLESLYTPKFNSLLWWELSAILRCSDFSSFLRIYEVQHDNVVELLIQNQKHFMGKYGNFVSKDFKAFIDRYIYNKQKIIC